MKKVTITCDICHKELERSALETSEIKLLPAKGGTITFSDICPNCYTKIESYIIGLEMAGNS